MPQQATKFEELAEEIKAVYDLIDRSALRRAMWDYSVTESVAVALYVLETWKLTRAELHILRDITEAKFKRAALSSDRSAMTMHPERRKWRQVGGGE